MSDTLEMATLELRESGVRICAELTGGYCVLGRSGTYVGSCPTLREAVSLARLVRDSYTTTAVTGA